jgi:hypothetical protein
MTLISFHPARSGSEAPPGSFELTSIRVPPADDDTLEAKLDLLIALLRIAYREPLAAEREAILSDPVNEALLATLAKGPLDAGELKSRAAARARASKPTIERRIADLALRGALKRSGSGAQVSYRSTGLFDL